MRCLAQDSYLCPYACRGPYHLKKDGQLVPDVAACGATAQDNYPHTDLMTTVIRLAKCGPTWAACGATAQDNYPHADLTVLDLSPYYLQEARANMRYWADKRAPKGAGGADALGGPDGTGTSYLQAAAEDIPQPDASFDVVRCELEKASAPHRSCLHVSGWLASGPAHLRVPTNQ